jgi:hypothetical protein
MMMRVAPSAFRRSLLLALLFVAACDKPGEGPVADLGRARGGELIAALATYHATHGSYPGSLQELVPAQLAAADLTRLTAEPLDFRYERAPPDGYTLEFAYTGPGRNVCATTNAATDPAWRCHGYY